MSVAVIRSKPPQSSGLIATRCARKFTSLVSRFPTVLPRVCYDLISSPSGNYYSRGRQRHAHAFPSCESPASPRWPTSAHPRPRCRVVVGATAARGRSGPSGRGGAPGLRALWSHPAVQDPQLGTGHAVAQAEPALGDFLGDVLVLYGDVPCSSPPPCGPCGTPIDASRQPSRSSPRVSTIRLDMGAFYATRMDGSCDCRRA